MKIKLKSKKSATKRFKRTGTGQIKCRRSGMRHNLTKKTHKCKKQLSGMHCIQRSDLRSVKRMLTQ